MLQRVKLADLREVYPFQWAPTLGGECYTLDMSCMSARPTRCFNGHPPLGVNATWVRMKSGHWYLQYAGRFNGHPPLGVNATEETRFATPRTWDMLFQWAPTLGGECYHLRKKEAQVRAEAFQWAPTLGGECYNIVYLITPPLCQGVNALLNISQRF